MHGIGSPEDLNIYLNKYNTSQYKILTKVPITAQLARSLYIFFNDKILNFFLIFFWYE